MPTVNVRQLDEEVVQRLKRRAIGNNRSLESEARHILERAAEEDMAEKLSSFRSLSKRLRKQTKGLPQTPSHIVIGEDRDSGHGPA